MTSGKSAGLNPYGETEATIRLVLRGMERYFCRKERNAIILVRPASGGERYGSEFANLRAKPGETLCYNPANGYRWVMQKVDDFYCKEGKRAPETQPRLQQDGARKGLSKHVSASNAEAAPDAFRLE